MTSKKKVGLVLLGLAVFVALCGMIWDFQTTRWHDCWQEGMSGYCSQGGTFSWDYGVGRGKDSVTMLCKYPNAAETQFATVPNDRFTIFEKESEGRCGHNPFRKS